MFSLGETAAQSSTTLHFYPNNTEPQVVSVNPAANAKQQVLIQGKNNMLSNFDPESRGVQPVTDEQQISASGFTAG